MPTDLSPLAHHIASLIRDEAMPQGTGLTERALGERLRLSRSPVRSALRELHDQGILQSAGRGLVVADPALAAQLAASPPPQDVGEALYLRLAQDRFAGELPDRVSENELLRRYDLTRPRLQSLLRRIAEEGWIERLPGHGWQFQPVLTSKEGYLQSYRFRQAIEPAALLEPGFQKNVGLLSRHLERQRALVAGDALRCSAVELFAENAALHEAIIDCSGNSFFSESLRRTNRLRRLMEYQLTLDREKARQRCREHIDILELILDDRPHEAAARMQQHLRNLGPMKTADQP